MLILTPRSGQTLQIFPSETLDPATTVAELFSSGPIIVVVDRAGKKRTRIGIEAPAALRISRDTT